MAVYRSPLAAQVQNARDPRDATKRTPWGLLLHTTGGGVTHAAHKQNKTPLSIALKVYIGSQNGDNGYLWGGPGYVLDHDGSLHQIAPDNARTEHAGGSNRWRYFDGSWEQAFPITTAAWKTKWGPKYNHPYQLFPARTPNVDYVGVEMIPCGDGFGTPMRSGLRFTRAQHNTAAALAREMGPRLGWPAGWQHTSRFLGHEDVDPLSRSWPNGSWDPGCLRPDPFFDFAYVRTAV